MTKPRDYDRAPQKAPQPVRYAFKPFAPKLDAIGREMAAGTQLSEDTIMKRLIPAIHDAANADLNTHEAPLRAVAREDPAALSKAMGMLMGKHQQRILNEMALAKDYVYFHAAGAQIFEFAPRLAEMFRHSEVTDVPVSQIKLPYSCFYIALTQPIPVPTAASSVTDAPLLFDGVYCRVENGKLVLMPTSPDTTEELASITPRWLYAGQSLMHSRPVIDLTMDGTLQDAITASVASYQQSVQKYSKNMASHLLTRPEDHPISTQSNVTIQQETEAQINLANAAIENGSIEAASTAIISWVANALCYLTAYRDAGTSVWAEGTPTELIDQIARMNSPTRIAKAEKELAWAGYRRVTLFDVQEHDEDAGGHHHASPETHWRRGHWRMQAHGEGRALRRLTWVRPCLVNRERGLLLHGHLYQTDTGKDPSSDTL